MGKLTIDFLWHQLAIGDVIKLENSLLGNFWQEWLVEISLEQPRIMNWIARNQEFLCMTHYNRFLLIEFDSLEWCKGLP